MSSKCPKKSQFDLILSQNEIWQDKYKDFKVKNRENLPLCTAVLKSWHTTQLLANNNNFQNFSSGLFKGLSLSSYSAAAVDSSQALWLIKLQKEGLMKRNNSGSYCTAIEPSTKASKATVCFLKISTIICFWIVIFISSFPLCSFPLPSFPIP